MSRSTSNPLQDEEFKRFIFDTNTYRKKGKDQINLDSSGDYLIPRKNYTKEEGATWSESKGVTTDDEQAGAVAAVLKKSATWGEDRNGTLVKFNVGGVKGDNALVYVFFNGRWIKTGLSEDAAGVVDAKEYID